MHSIALSTSIQYLKGVGEKRAQAYKKLNITDVKQLLYHFPRKYIDLSNPLTIKKAPFMELSPVKAVLTSKSSEQRIRKGLSIFKLIAVDETGELEITLYNTKYLVSSLQIDTEYIFYGQIEGSLLRPKMSAPQIFIASGQHKILPIYPQTANITSRLIQNNILQALDEVKELVDPIPQSYKLKYGIGDINTSIRNIHFPENMITAKSARNRFIFDELLTLSCGLLQLRAGRASEQVNPFTQLDVDDFYNSLPFLPTNAQKRAVVDITDDFSKTTPMNRLIQGDVGSGKTLVSAAAVYLAYTNNMQSAVMAPTSILAEQHYNSFSDFLEKFGVNIALLTGSTTAAERRKILAGIKDGSIHLCIGTHALLSDNVVYKNLGLVVTDEQHRFGVAQRAALSEKSKGVHVLVMSATPIPRTLSLIIYGDLSLSVIDELPPGRQPIETLLINSSKLSRALGFIKKNIDEGGQAYIVCPLVEQGEDNLDLKPAVEYSEFLAKGAFKGYNVGLIHGKLKAKEKESVMRDFKIGKIDLLVSTTVIEVGVDVPNATIMLIENAERFGLSQLHQLRGRVGRGEKQSYCILVSDANGEIAQKRLTAMRQTSDGFKLAEYDLKLRGPGDFFGYRQHGLPTLKIADLLTDMDVLAHAQDCAQDIIADDPTLKKKVHLGLRENVNAMIDSVGQRPN